MVESRGVRFWGLVFFWEWREKNIKKSNTTEIKESFLRLQVQKKKKNEVEGADGTGIPWHEM